jgi:hypothetical protein
MRTYLGVGIACLTLMLTGIARADYFNSNDNGCNARNKSVFLDYQISCNDLHGNNNHNDIDDNKGGNGGNQGPCTNNNNNDNNGGNCLPPVDTGCGDTHVCTPPPCTPSTCPHDPHDPAVVPLPASSALGGVGLAALALIGWIKSRRVARA